MDLNWHNFNYCILYGSQWLPWAEVILLACCLASSLSSSITGHNPFLSLYKLPLPFTWLFATKHLLCAVYKLVLSLPCCSCILFSSSLTLLVSLSALLIYLNCLSELWFGTGPQTVQKEWIQWQWCIPDLKSHLIPFPPWHMPPFYRWGMSKETHRQPEGLCGGKYIRT